ncbi:MAG: cation transporter [Chloroflexaceae bacterium]|nr:cation transporter [Chloroflexaceae bacterium]
MLERITFSVPQMDCAAEEQLVRMKLADYGEVKGLSFDLAARTVVVVHSGSGTAIERALSELNLGATVAVRELVDALKPDASAVQQRQLLIIVLLINGALFVLELAVGLIAQSMGLVADSLDMLADAIVYSLSLYAVGRAVAAKKRVTFISGLFQLALAIVGVIEVIRRFLAVGDEPDFTLMIGVSLLALMGNVASLLVLRRTQSQDANIKASQIFTSNDVLVNVGVILAGILVFLSGSNIPDLVIGAVVFCLVGYGAFRILRLSR